MALRAKYQINSWFGNKSARLPLLISVSATSTQFAMARATSDDLTLVHASRAGDLAAFEELIKRYDAKLLRIVQHVAHNREDAQDIVQEAFLKAFRKLGQFQGKSEFSTWLTRIAINESFMVLRKQRSQREVSLDQNLETAHGIVETEIADWTPNPEERYRASETREILIKALQELHQGLRVVFVLRDIEEFSLKQTAEALHLTVSAVKARSRRARLQLRKILSKYFAANESRQPTKEGNTLPVPWNRVSVIRNKRWHADMAPCGYVHG